MRGKQASPGGRAPASSARAAAAVAGAVLVLGAVAMPATGTPGLDLGREGEPPTLASSDADLGVTIYDDPDPVGAGSLLTYTVTVINFGPQNATSVSLDFTVSGDIADLAAANPECSVGFGNSAHCLIGDLAAGASLDMTFTCRSTTPHTVLRAMAVVGAEQSDANEQNNMAQEFTTVLDQPTTTEPGFPPGAHRVGAIYPNPSTGGLAFRLELEHDDEVRVAVYDLRGRRVAVAAARRVGAGEQAVAWQPKVERGGLYFVRIETASGLHAVRRWVVLE